jgi:hypothetical protein
MSEEKKGQPRTANPGEAVSGFPEPPGKDPGDRSKDPSPHHSLNTPVGEPDPTEWPDPYDRRPDPRGPVDAGEEVPHPPAGATSTSEPHPAEDLEAPDSGPPERDKLDE